MKESLHPIPTFTLNNGVAIPSIGFGTYKLNDPDVALRAINAAIAAGYRSIDCAEYYGNQNLVGHALTQSSVPRAELFISSKVWASDRGYDSTLRAFDRSIAQLELDYLDMYMIHWPATSGQTPDWRQENADTWRAMERLVAEGCVRCIGVCNFMAEHLDALIQEATIVPAVNQIEFHPGDNQSETARYCYAHNIRLEAWSPLARGRVMDNDVLTSIAQRLGVSVAQVCLRWSLQHGVIPLPKSQHPDRILSNIDVFGFALTPADMAAIDGLDGLDSSGLNPYTFNR